MGKHRIIRDSFASYGVPHIQVIVNDLVEYYIKHSRNQEANKAAIELKETVSRIL